MSQLELDFEETIEANEEEAAFYFMLHDFEYWVKKDGATFVMSRVDPDVCKKIADYFDV